MIGLSFLAVGLAWLAFSVWFAFSLGHWFGFRTIGKQGIVAAIALPILLIGPFVDHIIGMRQFERLCDEAKNALWVSPDIEKVKRAHFPSSPQADLTGYWINIRRYDEQYIDLDSGKTFMTFRNYSTPGGRIAGLAQMGGLYWCGVERSGRFSEIRARYGLDRLLDEGRKK